MGLPEIRRMGQFAVVNKRLRHAERRGSLIVEAAIASVLLVTATLALVKLASSSVQLNRQADQRLMVRLAAENTLQRLKSSSIDSLPQDAEQAAGAVAENCQCQVNVTTNAFTTNGINALHLRVDASLGDTVHVQLHDWRLDAEAVAENADASEAENAEEESDDQ